MAFTVADGRITVLDVYGDHPRVRQLAEPVLKPCSSPDSAAAQRLAEALDGTAHTVALGEVFEEVGVGRGRGQCGVGLGAGASARTRTTSGATLR
jgi:hypothetical protein